RHSSQAQRTTGGAPKAVSAPSPSATAASSTTPGEPRTDGRDDPPDPAPSHDLAVRAQALAPNDPDDGRNRPGSGGVRRHEQREHQRDARLFANRGPHRGQDRAAGDGGRKRIPPGTAPTGGGGGAGGARRSC